MIKQAQWKHAGTVWEVGRIAWGLEPDHQAEKFGHFFPVVSGKPLEFLK